MGNPHEMFKTSEDYERWEPYVLQCDEIDGLSDEQKGRAKQALEYLRSVLGENFVRQASRTRHPLIYLFLQATAWARVKLTGLAQALEALQGADNFRKILKRIRAPREKGLFTDGYSVLQTAYQFSSAGFKVCFVDERGGDKKPDIKLVNEETGEEVLVEVSALKLAAAVEAAQRASWPIHRLIFGPLARAQLTMFAEMREGFDEDYAPKAVEQLQEKIVQVKVSGEMEEMVNDYIVAAIAPDNKIEQLNQWALQRGVAQDVVGPPITLVELQRLCRKIREKLEEGQLPADKPSILVIPALSSFLFYLHDLKQVIGQLEKQAGDYPNLIAVVISQGYAEEPFGEVIAEELGPHTILHRMANGFPESIIILRNPNFTLSLSSSTLAKLRKVLGGDASETLA